MSNTIRYHPIHHCQMRDPGLADSKTRAQIPYALSMDVCVGLEQAFNDRLAVPVGGQRAWVARRPRPEALVPTV